MNLRNWGLAVCATVIVLTILASKDDVDRYLRMRRM
jgi:hypothetical protein